MAWNLRNHTLPSQGYTGGGASPTAIAAALAVHVSVAAVILLMPAETIRTITPDIIWAYAVPPEPVPPEPQPQPRAKDEQPVPQTQKREEVIVPADAADPFGSTGFERSSGGGEGEQIVEPTRRVAEPVFVQAVPDPKRMRDFQPDYPGAMIRAQVEGFATVRVFIGASGRVDTVELVDTNNAAFWQATRDQALRHWRFRPATRDGMAVASERVMTVRFRLSDLD